MSTLTRLVLEKLLQDPSAVVSAKYFVFDGTTHPRFGIWWLYKNIFFRFNSQSHHAFYITAALNTYIIVGHSIIQISAKIDSVFSFVNLMLLMKSHKSG